VLNIYIFGDLCLTIKDNILQFDTILNNEARMLESFFQIFTWQAGIFQNFWQFQKIIN
jgi:hypothetical protein